MRMNILTIKQLYFYFKLKMAELNLIVSYYSNELHTWEGGPSIYRNC
jgi:hypothetical protein